MKTRLAGLAVILYAFMITLASAANQNARIESPQVVNARGDVVGLYGGLMQVINMQGDAVTAFVVITSTGYVLPVTPEGEIGSHRSAYFAQENCMGEEYLSPIADRSGKQAVQSKRCRNIMLSWFPVRLVRTSKLCKNKPVP